MWEIVYRLQAPDEMECETWTPIFSGDKCGSIKVHERESAITIAKAFNRDWRKHNRAKWQFGYRQIGEKIVHTIV